MVGPPNFAVPGACLALSGRVALRGLAISFTPTLLGARS